MFNVNKIRQNFPMLKQKMQKHPLVFFDNASTTFKPKSVIEAISKYYESETSNSHRGDYDLCYHADKVIEETIKCANVHKRRNAIKALLGFGS